MDAIPAASLLDRCAGHAERHGGLVDREVDEPHQVVSALLPPRDAAHRICGASALLNRRGWHGLWVATKNFEE